MNYRSDGDASCGDSTNLRPEDAASNDEDSTPTELLPPDLQTHVSSTMTPKRRLALPTVLVSPSSTVIIKEDGEDMQELEINSALLSPSSYTSVSDKCSSRPMPKNTSLKAHVSVTSLRREDSRCSLSDDNQYISHLTHKATTLPEIQFMNRESAKTLALGIEKSINTPTRTNPIICTEGPKYQMEKETRDRLNEKPSKESVRMSFASKSSDLASTSHDSREWSWHSSQHNKFAPVLNSSRSSSGLGSVVETRFTEKAAVKPLSPTILRKSWSPKQGEDISPILDQFLGQASKPGLSQDLNVSPVMALKVHTAASASCLRLTEPPVKPSERPSPRTFYAKSTANPSKGKAKSVSLLSPSFQPLLAKQRSKSADVRNSREASSAEQLDESSGKRSFLSLLSPSRILSYFKRSTQSIPASENSCRKSRRRHIDHPEDQKVVVINVSGRRFKIDDYFLSIYPETLLGSKGRSIFYDAEKKEYFFDRDPDTFRHIWNFYCTGDLHCPQDECLDAFVDEMKYFGLSENHMCSYCWADVFSPIIDQLTNKRKDCENENERVELLKRALDPDKTFRQRLWATFQDPSISFPAKILYLLSAVVILVSVLANAVETIPCSGDIQVCNEENEEEYFIIDSVCVGLFTLEYLVKLYACPSRLAFMKNFMSVIDLLAILPYYADLVLERLAGSEELGMDVFVTLRVLRILRVFKLLRQSKRLQNLITNFKRSASDLGMILFMYMVMVIVFSSMIYFAETNSNPQFGSIPESMWYAVVTTTTTGYGDIVPKTLIGKMVGSVCCVLGIIVIAFPVPVLQIKR